MPHPNQVAESTYQFGQTFVSDLVDLRIISRREIDQICLEFENNWTATMVIIFLIPFY
jgi:hypothetical protein